MAQRESALLTATPGTLSGLAVIFLLLAAFFALLNGHKVKALRGNAATARALVPAKVNASTAGTTGAQQQGKTADPDRAAKAEAALARADKEKADLKGKLDASQQEIAALRQRAARPETTSSSSASGNPAPADNARTPLYNRKLMTFDVSWTARRKKKSCWPKNCRTHNSARHK